MVYFMPCHSLSRASVNLKVTGAFFNSRESNTLIRMTACGKTIAVAGVDRAEHLALILRRLWRERSWHLHLTRRLLRHAYFKKVSQCLLNRAQVLLHHLLAFLPVGVTNGLTYGFDRFIARQNFRDGKETDLHDGVHARSHTGLASAADNGTFHHDAVLADGDRCTFRHDTCTEHNAGSTSDRDVSTDRCVRRYVC